MSLVWRIQARRFPQRRHLAGDFSISTQRKDAGATTQRAILPRLTILICCQVHLQNIFLECIAFSFRTSGIST